MAIFQPANIIPSSFTEGTVDAVKDNMEISWQVNGNSAMTAFQIDFYLNDTASTFVYSTGKLPKSGETQAKYNLPFYGTDRFGRPQFFTYNASRSWVAESLNKFTNGNNYKFKITQYYMEGDVEKSVVQTSFSSFITRATPTLTLYQTDENYANATLLPSSIATSIGYFQAKYVQEQDDSIRWVRWQIATATKNSDNTYTFGDILVDTGDIYTPTLNFEFNGFFNGQNYAIRCFGESESGQATQLQGANADGWIFFNINIENSALYTGNLSVQCLHKENAALLKWESVEVISPAVSPEEYQPTLSDGSVILLPKDTETGNEYSITWNKIGAENKQEDMNFNSPWTAVWKGKIYNPNIIQTRTVSLSATVPANGSATRSVTLTSARQIVSVRDDPSSIISWSYTGNTVTVEFTNRTPFEQTMSSQTSVRYISYISGTVFQILPDDIKIGFSATTRSFVVESGDTTINFVVNERADTCACMLTPNSMNIFSYLEDGTLLDSFNSAIEIISVINSISISGGNVGSVIDSVSVFKGDGENILPLYESNSYFEPVWNSSEYDLYMTANFNGNLEGGTGTASGAGFRVYRQEVGKNVLAPIATVSSTTTSLKDYGISSRRAYKYSLYAYDTNSAFMGGVDADNVIATNFNNYSLLVCDYDYDKDEYHVRKQYLFALNLSTGSVGNNNSPTLNKNFTQYPTRMPDTANYASGTLSGLIGAIYTVPALIEQIGQYKWTAKPSTLDYFDSVDLEKELYDLSTAPYQLFLRDMKGRLRMIATSGVISMTTNIKQKQQSISISFPWVEVGDASDVTIIQTPDDYGWNNDNQVLDVQLDVDVETGELSATYPFPYNGTKFYLTGVNKENLTAKTRLGVTPAQFNLSDTATKTTDGEVTATVTVNSEVDK